MGTLPNAMYADVADTSIIPTRKSSWVRLSSYDRNILLCRRAIDPRKNYWTLPAGFLEEHETPEDGARREAREEALCDIEFDALLAVYSVPHISQVQLMYRARLATPDFAPGPESLETKLFAWDDIPWNELGFPQRALGAAPFPPDAGSGRVRALHQPARRTARRCGLTRVQPSGLSSI